MILDKMKWFALLIFAGIGLPVFGQDYDYIQFTTKDGLPTNYVYGVLEDEEGTIWAYTENGLSKFDGYSFKNYTTRDGLPGNDIIFAEKDIDGKIWLNIHKGGAGYLYKDSIYTIYEPTAKVQHLRNGYYSFNCPATQRKLIYANDTLQELEYTWIDSFFIANERDILTIDSIKILNPDSPPPNPSSFEQLQYMKEDTLFYFSAKNYIYGFILSKEEYFLYSFHSGNIYYKKNKNKKIVPIGYFPYLTFNLDIKQIGKSETYIMANSHVKPTSSFFLLNFKDDIYKPFNLIDYNMKAKVHLRSSISDSSFMMITETGFLEFDFEGRLLDKLIYSNLGEKFYLLRAYKDRRQNIWLGTREGGLLLIPAQKRKTKHLPLPNSKDAAFEHFIKTPGEQLLAITDNTGVYVIKNDSLWEVSAPEKLKRFRSATYTPFGALLSSASNSTLIQEKNDQLKFMNAKDFFKYDLEKLTAATNQQWKESDLKNKTSLAYHTGENSIYTANYNLSKQTINSDFELEPTYYKNIKASQLSYRPQNNILYISDKNSLYEFKDQKHTPFLDSITGLKNITKLYNTKEKLWIGTESNGLYSYHFARKEINHYNINYYIRNIRTASDSTMILATNNGVYIISESDTTRNAWEHYTDKDGLALNEIQDVIIHNGKLYIANSSGVQIIDNKNNYLIKPNPLDLSLTNIKVNNIRQPKKTAYSLRNTENNIEINYILKSYESYKSIQYYTKLTPLEKEWKKTKETKVFYLSIPPDDYTFHLKATDIYGNEFSVAPLPIHIKKAYWQYWWFWVLAGLGIAILIILYYQAKEKETRLEMEKEKETSQKIAELELSALRAQMNPHFVFNALGAIQYFIQMNDVDTADDYLTQFAMLIRKYLESSKEKFISLEDEINLLEIYTDLEQMRFEDLFKVEFEIESNIDLKKEYVPSMLIQTFVDNAINHGLRERRDKKGKLILSFSKIENNLICEIKDNGIGITQAKQKKNRGHQSRGLAIIEDKIQTLRQSNLADISIKTTNFKYNNTNFPGTHVTITIKNLTHEKI